MNKAFRIGIGVIVVVALLAGISWGLLTEVYPRMYDDGTYEAQIEALQTALMSKQAKAIALNYQVYELRDEAWAIEKRHRLEVEELSTQLFGKEQETWRLEDVIAESAREKDRLKWDYDQAIKRSRNLYEDALDKLERRLEATQTEVGELREQLNVEAMNWGDARDFNSFEEFQEFIWADQTNKLAYDIDTFQCDNYLETLIRNAAIEGFRLREVWMFLSDGNQIYSWHVLCQAIIRNYTFQGGEVGDVVVVVEPQTDEWFIVGVVDRPETWRSKIIPFLP